MSKQHERQESRLTVSALAERLGCPFRGNGDTVIHGVSGLETAKAGQLSFLSSPKYRKLLANTKASALILPPDEPWDRTPTLLSENPYLTFIRAVQIFFSPYRPEPGIQPTAWIAPSARLGRNVAVGALAYIGENVRIGDRTVVFPLAAIYPNTEIGEDCVIYSHASIRENVRLGRRNIIHNGTVIGSDGFGYQKTPEGEYLKIPQKGTVIIEDDVEIGANAAVDRGALEATIIRKGTKIDNLVQVAHNVEIGSDSILAAQTGIAGSSRLGSHVITGGQVGIADHIEVGDEAIAAAKTGITKSIPPGAFVSGSPHLDIKVWRKAWASIPQLYELIREIRRLKKKVEKLENEIEKNNL